MNRNKCSGIQGLESWRVITCLCGLVFLVGAFIDALGMQAGKGANNVLIWDTSTPIENLTDSPVRPNWQLVPPNLMLLEDDPVKSSRDPGYYGRDYSFKGEAVVENDHYLILVRIREGQVLFRSKSELQKRRLELAPLAQLPKTSSLQNCIILRNTGDEAVLHLSYAAAESKAKSALILYCDHTELLGIEAVGTMQGVSIRSAIEYGIVPNFIADDLIYSPGEGLADGKLNIPSENVFVGLLEGANDMLVLTWPDGKQKIQLERSQGRAARQIFTTIDFRNDGKCLNLALLAAQDIWRREELRPNFLEKDVKIEWQRPYAAKWQTQLLEARIKTTFRFRESRGDIWRGAFGSYMYPVWFDGADTWLRLGKKIPPKGEAIIYALERKGTPRSIKTVVDIMKESLGRPTSNRLLDPAGRKLRTHHRRGANGIRRACTCGCTEAIEQVFKAQQEVARRDYVEGAVDDMVFFVHEHMARIDEYMECARDVMKLLEENRQAKAELAGYLDELKLLALELPQEYTRRKEHIQSLAYVDELARKTKLLTRRQQTTNLPSCLALGKQWRAMGAAQDDLVAQLHRLTRKLFQEAAYRSVDQVAAMEVAQKLRERCIQCLRRADGYEIWADY
jgi:hypothetical protein